DLTQSQCQAKLNQMVAQGYQPIRVQAGGAGAAARFAVIFAKTDTPADRVWTATGTQVPELESFDNAVQAFMQTSGVRAGSLAVTRNGRLVLARGYTWAQPGYPTTEPTTLFRIASCSKPLTSIAIFQQIEAGHFQ